jgi:hypothetical protein
MPRVVTWPEDEKMQYLDGQAWEFIEGEDYEEDAGRKRLLQNLRNRAIKHGMRYKSASTQDGFVFQAWDEDTDG